MKKFFTLVLGLIVTVAMFAADRKPTVTVTSARRYAVVIDGKRYFSHGSTFNIPNLFYGPHEVRVYKMRPGFYMRQRRLVAHSTFLLRNSDIQINVDRFGRVQISESKFGRDGNDHGWGNDRDYGRGNDRNYDNGYDPNYEHGRGNHDRNF